MKDRDSLLRKLSLPEKTYGILSEVTDIVGIRVVTYFADDVDIVAKMIEREFDVDAQNSLDKGVILEPNQFGYRSVHYVCKLSPPRLSLVEYRRFERQCCEIQIRSILQHAWAEIEHDLGYKSRAAIPAQFERRFARIASLLELADEEFKGVRDGLQAYADEVRHDFTNRPNELPIDRVTLEEFVRRDPFVIELEQELASVTGHDRPIMQQDSERVFEWVTSLMREAGFTTIGEIKRALETERDLMADVLRARHEERGLSSTPQTGLSLAILFVTHLALQGREVLADSLMRAVTNSGVSPIEGIREESLRLADMVIRVQQSEGRSS